MKYTSDIARRVFVYFNIDASTPIPKNASEFRSVMWRALKQSGKWAWSSAGPGATVLTVASLVAYIDARQMPTVISPELALPPVDNVHYPRAAVCDTSVECVLRPVSAQEISGTTKKLYQHVQPQHLSVAKMCVQQLYSEHDRSMPDQFFFVHLDSTQPSGYNALTSGLLHEQLVISQNQIRTKTQAHHAKSIDYNYKHPKQAYVLNKYEWCEQSGYGVFLCDEHYVAPEVNLACVANGEGLYHCALFEHSENNGHHMQVYLRNLCRDAVAVIKKVLLNEVNFNVHQVDADVASVKCNIEAERVRLCPRPSVFEPIIIAGATLQEALLSVANIYDVHNYQHLDKPKDAFGAPWYNDYLYSLYVHEAVPASFRFTSQQLRVFEQRAHTQYPSRTITSPTAEKRAELMDAIINLCFWAQGVNIHARAHSDIENVWHYRLQNQPLSAVVKAQNQVYVKMQFAMLQWYKEQQHKQEEFRMLPQHQQQKTFDAFYKQVAQFTHAQCIEKWKEVLATHFVARNLI
jgi:hypothetical protein